MAIIFPKKRNVIFPYVLYNGQTGNVSIDANLLPVPEIEDPDIIEQSTLYDPTLSQSQINSMKDKINYSFISAKYPLIMFFTPRVQKWNSVPSSFGDFDTLFYVDIPRNPDPEVTRTFTQRNTFPFKNDRNVEIFTDTIVTDTYTIVTKTTITTSIYNIYKEVITTKTLNLEAKFSLNFNCTTTSFADYVTILPNDIKQDWNTINSWLINSFNPFNQDKPTTNIFNITQNNFFIMNPNYRISVFSNGAYTEKGVPYTSNTFNFLFVKNNIDPIITTSFGIFSVTLPVAYQSITKLTANLLPNATTMNVNSTKSFPKKGILYIDNESIIYKEKTNTSFTGLVRGYKATQATTHNSGADVYLIDRMVNLLNTSTTAMITSTDTEVEVGSTNGFFSSGTIYIDTEAITYTGKTETTFTGLTRGVKGTTASSHSNYSIVWLI
jgi:hypothetical protein